MTIGVVIVLSLVLFHSALILLQLSRAPCYDGRLYSSRFETVNHYVIEDILDCFTYIKKDAQIIFLNI